MSYDNKLAWRVAALKKYNCLTSKVSSRNIMLYSGGKLVATFNRVTNRGIVF